MKKLRLRQTMFRLGLLARMASPSFVRRAYRVVNAIRDIPGSKSLSAASLKDCRFFASRYDMLEFLPNGGRVAEIGTYKGHFAIEVLARNKPSELHLVDLEYSHLEKKLNYDQRVVRHEGFSSEVIASFADNSFDWIYLDADHSYEGTLRDARVSALKIKPGGYIVFNDFAHSGREMDRYGVHRAAVDFANETNWPIVCFAYDTNALYDIALQRPANTSGAAAAGFAQATAG